jgi:glutathione peroxidase
MTTRQKLLQFLYPLWMLFGDLTGRRNTTRENKNRVQPSESFYELSIVLNNGDTFDFSQLKGKKVLLVNTASDCGYTHQYEALQELYQQFKDKIVVIGFPANDFKEQETGNDEDIAVFCKQNYGITFPLAKKTAVTGESQNEVFRWLSDKTKNGWNSQQPTWNFSKYLVSEDGVLLRYLDPGISPMNDELIRLIK